MRKKQSLIWKIPDFEFKKLIEASKTYKEALLKIGFAVKSGGNYKTLKQRIKQDNINDSHIINNMKQFRGASKKKTLYEVLIRDSDYNTYHLKNRLIKEGVLSNKCYKCGLESEWQGESISLQMDHINGDHNDNRLENLRILCPNCHSQTKTYGSKNSKRSINKDKICKCGSVKNRKAIMCSSCWTQPDKIKWPSNDELKQRLENQSYVSLAKELGVSDNAIRRRLKKDN